MKTKIVAWDRFLKVERQAREAMRLASRHDPDFEKRLDRLTNHVNREIGVAQKLSLHDRLDIIERQLERLGAPKYRKLV